jgi:primase-polymerase (primpol)-like protein
VVTLISDLVNIVPEELQTLPQWVVWRYEPNGDKKPKKVPYQPNNPTYKAATTNSAHWATFQTASATEGFTGIGFVFTPDDPYCGIDLDNCIVNGKTAPWAQAILDAFPGYAEISPSGNGIKLIGKGELKKAQKGQYIELYNQDRYFTITGNSVDARTRVKPWPNLDDLFHSVKYIDKAIRKPAFPALFHGQWEGKFKSESEADLAISKELISCGVPDLETLMCAIRLSGLYDEKWEREDYQERTYEEACRQLVSQQQIPAQIGQEGSTASQLLLSLVEEG